MGDTAVIAQVRVTRAQIQGFEALTVSNDVLSLTIVPDLGGKITSIRDLRTGREWLWTSDELPYRRLSYGASYLRQADTGSWDDCFPTVAACAYPREPWRGVAVRIACIAPSRSPLGPRCCASTID